MKSERKNNKSVECVRERERDGQKIEREMLISV